MADALPRNVAALGRLVLNFRLVVLLVCVLVLPETVEERPLLVGALLVLAGVSLGPLLTWDRFAPFLMRHPSLLAIDLVLSIGILLLAGTDSPFLVYTLGTAFLAGFLYGYVGAAVLGTLLALAYVVVWAQRAGMDQTELSFQSGVTVPVLYVLLALGAAAVRRLQVQQAQTEADLAVASHAAATGAERARLAREMHDTLGKTLQGIALSASAIPGWVARDPERAARDAQRLSRAAETAARQARELIDDLRTDRVEQPLHLVVGDYLEAWSAETGLVVDAYLEPVEGIGPGSRYELFCTMKEALRNVERHARASQVHVELGGCEKGARLVVLDDGVGMPSGVDLEALAADDHYGLVGMTERARRVGGACEFRCPPEGGFEVVVEASRRAAADGPFVDAVEEAVA